MTLDLNTTTFNKLCDLWMIISKNKNIDLEYLIHICRHNKNEKFEILDFGIKNGLFGVNENNTVYLIQSQNIEKFRLQFITNYIKNNIDNLLYKKSILKGRASFIKDVGVHSNIYQIMNDAGLIKENTHEAAVFWKFIDAIARNKLNLLKGDYGLIGEEFSIQLENSYLQDVSIMIPKPKKTCRWISIDFPHAGYDIRSYYIDFKKRYVKKRIEVKTSRDIIRGRMFITWNEWRRMRYETDSGKFPAKYVIHLWDIHDLKNPKLAILSYADIAPSVPRLRNGGKIESFNIDVRRFYDADRFHNVPNHIATSISQS
jgi:hypothetical protein